MAGGGVPFNCLAFLGSFDSSGFCRIFQSVFVLLHFLGNDDNQKSQSDHLGCHLLSGERIDFFYNANFFDLWYPGYLVLFRNSQRMGKLDSDAGDAVDSSVLLYLLYASLPVPILGIGSEAEFGVRRGVR